MEHVKQLEELLGLFAESLFLVYCAPFIQCILTTISCLNVIMTD